MRARRAALRVGGRTALALAPALLLGLYAGFPALAFLSYVALVPWIVLYTDERRGRVGYLYYAVGAYLTWIALHPPFFRFGWYTPFAMAVFFFVPWLPFAPLLRFIHQRLALPRAVTVPVIWVALEWFRAAYTLSHFDLYRLGYSQARFPAMIQVVDIVGVYGLSFLVAAVNGLLSDLYFAARRHGWSPGRTWRERRIALGAVWVAAAFGAVLIYGAVRLGEAGETDGPTVAVVQPNVRHTATNVPRVHLTQLALTELRVEPGEADLIVWPENAILDHLFREPAYLEDLAWLSGSKRALLLVGAMGAMRGFPGMSTNTAVMVDDRGEILGHYDKQVLFPWSEYVPLDDLLGRFAPAIQRLHRWISRTAWGVLSNGIHGERTTLFEMPWNGESLPFATLICLENTYPPVPAEAGRLGARFFVNITSEGEVGGPVQEQLLRICILRAVENRIPYVRVGNTGISCFIDSFGKVRSVLRGRGGAAVNVEGVLVDRVPLSRGGATLYSRSRDAFALACVGATLLGLGLGWVRPRAPAEPGG